MADLNVHQDPNDASAAPPAALQVVDAVCPHKGGPIADGQSDGRVVLCPLHLTAFDLQTGCAVGAGYALATYPAQVDEAGHVLVQLPD